MDKKLIFLGHGIEELGSDKVGDLIAGTDPDTLVKAVRKLPFPGPQVMIAVIKNPGKTVAAAKILNGFIKLSPVDNLVEHGIAALFEGSSEGMQRFLESQKGSMSIPTFQNHLIRQINDNVDPEMVGERGDTREAGPVIKRELKDKNGKHLQYMLCIGASRLCTLRKDKNWKIVQDGEVYDMVERNCSTPSSLATPLHRDCWPGAHRHQPTADDLTIKIEEVIEPLPPGAPNWILEVDDDKRAALLGLYMAALDHTTYDAPEGKDGSDDSSVPTSPASEETRSWMPDVSSLILTVIVVACMFIGLVALFANGLTAFGFLGLATSVVLIAAIANTTAMVWRVTDFKDVSVNPRHKFENLDGLAFRLQHGLEWMARNSPSDLNLLLKSGLSFEEAREKATESFSEIVPAVLLTTRGVNGIPWWVPILDTADVAVQMPTLRRWLRLTALNGGKFAARGAMLFVAFVLLPFIIVYGGTLLTAVFFLVNGIAGFFYAFGATEHYSIIETAMTLIGQSSFIADPKTTDADYNAVPLLGLVIAASQVWIFRFMIVTLVSPIELVLTGGAQPKISRHSGRENFLVTFLRWINNRFPETMRVQIAPPVALTAKELLDLKRITGNPRVKHLALIIVLISATATFLGSSYNVLTGQYVLANAMLCFILLIAILAEVTAMLSYLMDTERKVDQSQMVQNVIFGLVVLGGFALLLIGAGTITSVVIYGATTYAESTRIYQSSSDSLDEWIADDGQVATPTPKAKPTSTQRSKAEKPKGDIDQAACKRFPDLCK